MVALPATVVFVPQSGTSRGAEYAVSVPPLRVTSRVAPGVEDEAEISRGENARAEPFTAGDTLSVGCATSSTQSVVSGTAREAWGGQ